MGGKLAYLTANPVTIHKGRRAIAQAISDNRVKARGPRQPCMNPLAHQPFHFNPLRNSPPKDMPRDDGSNYPPLPGRTSIGHECNRQWRDHRAQLPRFPLPSLDHGFKSDHYQCLLCCPGLTIQTNQDIPDEVDDTEKRYI